ncbi:urease accessory protein UreF [Octadecabacter sp. G9-8]|uniref:Urease accessory protein UreF n=2 Tax=Octadecabacter dasysiphoniae TaxID=2909341 RepID=A0ABS9CYN3_9RHOB|nr:urease accessory UreF family protein [Octadecabacter dasysiphoniae]MCF2872390.1 urease accessory protein UreF [Octadecabacter dasysiphoniae]
MRTDPVLTLAQWFSPSFPIGAFAYSHGLEQAIADGRIVDAATLSDWIETVLRQGSGHNDAVFLAAAYHGDAVQIDAYARAFMASKERVMEADLQGDAFCKITTSLTGYDLRGLTYPVAVGRAACLADLPLHLTISMYLQALVSSLVSVGVRLIPIGQTEGHQIIATFAPLCSQIAEIAKAGDLATLTSTAFLSDIAAMRHETLTTRVFRT